MGGADSEGTGGSGGGKTTPPPPTTFEKMVEAMGGKKALNGLDALQVMSTGGTYHHGHQVNPSDPAPSSSNYTANWLMELGTGDMRVDYERDHASLIGLKLNYSEHLVGQLGVIEGRDGIFGSSGAMTPARAGSTRTTLHLLYPHLIVHELLDDPSQAVEAGSAEFDGTTHEVLGVAGPVAPLQLWVDAESGKLSRILSTENSHFHRDVQLEALYAGWDDLGGDVRIPSKVTISLDGNKVSEDTRLMVTPNPAYDPATLELPAGPTPTENATDFAWGQESSQFHQMQAAFGLPLDFREVQVTPTELAPGVFRLSGGTYHSMAIEQDAGIVILEAPLYPERSRAILNWADATFPGKDVTHVVSTHPHHVVAGGLREFVAEGVTVVLASSALPAFNNVFTGASTIQPDTLSLTPATFNNLTVDDNGAVILADSTHPITVHHVVNVHSLPMVMALIEINTGNILFETSLYLPGGGGTSFQVQDAQSLMTAITTKSLTVNTIVGGLGGFAPFSELQNFLNPI